MASRFSAWRALDPAERRVAVGVAIALPLVSIALAWSGYGRTRALIERSTTRPRRDAAVDELAQCERAADVVAGVARRGFFAANCLRRSLVLYGLLRLRGFAPRHQLGVRRVDGRIDAHAWVEVGGVALGERSLQHLPFPVPVART